MCTSIPPLTAANEFRQRLSLRELHDNRVIAIKYRIPRAIHLAHPTFAAPVRNYIITQGFADHAVRSSLQQLWNALKSDKTVNLM
jgi:hypothetical protein